MKHSPLALLTVAALLFLFAIYPTPAHLATDPQGADSEPEPASTTIAQADAPTATATRTPTRRPSPTHTTSPVATATVTNTPRPTFTPSPTATRLPQPTPTATISGLVASPTITLTGVVTGDLVNLRAGPGISFDQVGRVVLSDTVTITGRNTTADWWQLCCLTTAEATVWISADFVALESTTTEALAALPVISHQSKQVAAFGAALAEADSLTGPTTGVPYQPQGQIDADLVNLRAGPGVTFARLGQVRQDETYALVGRNEAGDWWQICCPLTGETSAWISADFVTVAAPEAQLEALVPRVAVETESETDDALTTTTGQSDAAPPPLPVVSPTDPLPSPGGFGPPGPLNPLTGLPLDPAVRNHKPVIVCINNDAAARPQFGTGQADVMYEYLMEGYYITRFSGIFYGQTVDQIGPVRSARLVNYYMGALYNTPLLCSGASDQVRHLLKHVAPFPYLDIDLDDPNNGRYSDSIGTDYRTRLRTSTTGFRNWLSDWAVDGPAGLRGFTFGPLPAGGQPAYSIDIPYPAVTGSNVAYVYDPDSGRYLRYLGDAPHLDGNTGEQVAVENVIVQVVPHQPTDIVEDSLGSTSIRLNLFGSNRAIVFRDGVAFAGSWQSNTQGDLPRFFDQNGAEIPLKPGQTWISVVTPQYEIIYE